MPKKQPVNRSEFVRKHLHLDTKGIIAEAKKQGIKIAPSTVYQARATAKAHKQGDAQRKRGLQTRRRKVVPTSALEKHITERQRALTPGQKVALSAEYLEFQRALSDFIMGAVAGVREMVHAEMRAYFAKLGG